MELDQYQQAWNSTAGQTKVKIDTELLAKAVQESHRGFQSTIYWRDCREVGVSLFLLPFWVYMGLTFSLPWTWWLGVPSLIWVAGFILVDRKRHPQRPSEPGEPLNLYAKEALTHVEHQIWLLRNVFWWYLLPLGVSMMAFFVQTAWNSSISWWGFSLSVFLWSLFVLVIYGAIYGLNQYAVRSSLEPRRQDLLKLVAGLEAESSGEEPGDIVDLVAAYNDPAHRIAFGSPAWATNWNQIVPSWRVAMTIMIPTLVGAMCGLYSGLGIRMPEMGPVFFQVVVGAVIPFEIAIFSFMYLSHRRKLKMQSAAASAELNAPTSEFVVGQSKEPAAKRLPHAPALLILVLTLFIGIMAILAVLSFSFSMSDGADSLSNTTHNLPDPDFGDVSAFNDDNIASIDCWLQKQVDVGADDTVHPATGYDDSGRQREEKASFRERLAGSGGLFASVEDLAKFVQLKCSR